MKEGIWNYLNSWRASCECYIELSHPEVLSCLFYSYGAGDVFICFASALAHRVSPWTNIGKMAADGLTPGRISTAFFFPKPSLTLLEDKKEDWGSKTDFGGMPSHPNNSGTVVKGETGKRRMIIKRSKAVKRRKLTHST